MSVWDTIKGQLGPVADHFSVSPPLRFFATGTNAGAITAGAALPTELLANDDAIIFEFLAGSIIPTAAITITDLALRLIIGAAGLSIPIATPVVTTLGPKTNLSLFFSPFGIITARDLAVWAGQQGSSFTINPPQLQLAVNQTGVVATTINLFARLRHIRGLLDA